VTAKIERVDQPEPGLLCVTIRVDQTNRVLVLSTHPGALGVGIIDDRPRGRHAHEAISQLRRHATGATIDLIEQSNRFIRVSLTRAGTTHSLVCAPRKPHGGWWLADADGSTIVRSPGAQPISLGEDEHFRECDLASLRESGNAVLSAHRAARKNHLSRLVEKHQKRLSKKRDAILQDLKRAAQADKLHERATLILAYSAEIPANSSSFEAKTWDESPRTVLIELDPTTSPPELAQRLFQKSKRLKRGLDVAPHRLEAVESELEALEHLKQHFDHQTPETLVAKLAGLGIATTSPKEEARERRKAGGRSPYREFAATDGTQVLVGRSAADNDRLTLRVARPQDLWLHARGVTGAHVVVPLAKGKSCSPEALVDAATLAAHFSDLRGELVVDVLYAPRRFVHKRKGSAMGSVSLDREKVIAVRVEADRLARLLTHEKKEKKA
jgi:predicted ribosome quality control (RQC) complex YloA/Tae2 family protein